jgi:hypothetical protein
MKLIRLSVFSGKLDIKLKSRIYKFQYIAKKNFVAYLETHFL